ncbi:MAG TPA: hypothetical protein VFS63_10095 [Pseudolabrys sp.]|jgi:hypothetical protein|nr:hypothetical protein [Pseudolabrys sp.]
MAGDADQGHFSETMERERRAIQRELVALAERANKAGLTSIAQVIDLLIAQCMASPGPEETKQP